MKLLFASVIAASTVMVVAPSMAQSVYIGPGGVSVGVGGHPYARDYRDRGLRDRGAYEGRRPAYEGRSAYRPGPRGDRFDRY